MRAGIACNLKEIKDLLELKEHINLCQEGLEKHLEKKNIKIKDIKDIEINITDKNILEFTYNY